MLTRPDKSERIVIVGAGIFGLSTAYHLLNRGYTNVTILDRAETLPAEDAASSDLNKVVRSSYEDEFYAKLAQRAIDKWSNDEDWKGMYHESGVLVYSDKFAKIEGIYKTDKEIGASVDTFFLGSDLPLDAYVRLANRQGTGAEDSEVTVSDGASHPDYSFPLISPTSASSPSIAPSTSTDSGTESDISVTSTSVDTDIDFVGVRSFFPPDVDLGEALLKGEGYLNRNGGWACADSVYGGSKRACDLVTKAGGKIHSSKEVMRLLTSENGINTVECSDGSAYPADMVVLATGAWTASTFPELIAETQCEARGQCVAGIQLTESETERYRDCPVIVEFGSTGFYIFPPNRDGVMKFALHSAGYRNPDSENGRSKPRKIISDGGKGLRIPEKDELELRHHLRTVYPQLADREFKFTRMCWYTDSPDSNWLIDLHPSKPGIAFATSGSGHAYKFLPVIGELVADRLQGNSNDIGSLDRLSYSHKRSMEKHEKFRDTEPKLLSL